MTPIVKSKEEKACKKKILAVRGKLARKEKP